jgi:hypothetical protein
MSSDSTELRKAVVNPYPRRQASRLSANQTVTSPISRFTVLYQRLNQKIMLTQEAARLLARWWVGGIVGPAVGQRHMAAPFKLVADQG